MTDWLLQMRHSHLSPIDTIRRIFWSYSKKGLFLFKMHSTDFWPFSTELTDVGVQTTLQPSILRSTDRLESSWLRKMISLCAWKSTKCTERTCKESVWAIWHYQVVGGFLKLLKRRVGSLQDKITFSRNTDEGVMRTYGDGKNIAVKGNRRWLKEFPLV